MARLRRNSSVLEAARQRLAGLKTITPAPDFGPNLTVAAFEAKVNLVGGELDGYNQDLAAIDERLNRFERLESELNDLTRRYLSATEAQYGPDSSEYEMVGGTRKSERKRPTRKGGGSGSSTPKP